jgi:hypothetical protein
VPLPKDKLYVWGTFNSKIPISALKEGTGKKSEQFIEQFSSFHNLGVEDILQIIKNTVSGSFEDYHSFLCYNRNYRYTFLLKL